MSQSVAIACSVGQLISHIVGAVNRRQSVTWLAGCSIRYNIDDDIYASNDDLINNKLIERVQKSCLK